MNKVILRFLKNKAIEIGEFMIKTGEFIGVFILVVFAVAVASVVLAGLGYIVDSIFKGNTIWEKLIEFMATYDVVIYDRIGTGVVFIFTVCISIAIVYFTVKWLKENWQRAKREIEEETK